MSRPVYELEEDMPTREIIEWPVFWKWRSENEKKALEKAEREARVKRGSRGRGR